MKIGGKSITELVEMSIVNLSECREWEHVQENQFGVEAKLLKLLQTQQVGSFLINEVKNTISLYLPL